MQFWPPDDEHMCSKHIEAWNKPIVKQNFCVSSWLITEINILRCTVSKTSKFISTSIVVLPRKWLKENFLIGAHILFIDNSAWLECKRMHTGYQAITHFPLGWPAFVFLEGSTVSLVSRTKWGSGAQHRPAQLAARSAYKRDATPEVRHSSTLTREEDVQTWLPSKW